MALTENTSPTEPKYLELLVNRAFAEYRLKEKSVLEAKSSVSRR